MKAITTENLIEFIDKEKVSEWIEIDESTLVKIRNLKDSNGAYLVNDGHICGVRYLVSNNADGIRIRSKGDGNIRSAYFDGSVGYSPLLGDNTPDEIAASKLAEKCKLDAEDGKFESPEKQGDSQSPSTKRGGIPSWPCITWPSWSNYSTHGKFKHGDAVRIKRTGELVTVFDYFQPKCAIVYRVSKTGRVDFFEVKERHLSAI